MMKYNVDFLSQSVRQNGAGVLIGTLSDIKENSRKSHTLPTLDRSAGSPDSLRSETSSESRESITDMLLSLQKQADVISDARCTETEKPGHSYIALISMAILSSKDKKMVLGEIYGFIMTKFPYYNNQEKAWRNSIRHNLSVNECFIKNGRADNGKGNYWSIHSACVDDFAKGDYRRRQARRRARKGGKCVNRSHYLATENQSNNEYVPMTPSQLRYPHQTSSMFGYQPMTSLPVDYQSMTSLPFDYQSMTSSPDYQSMTSSPVDYQSITSSPVGYQSLSAGTTGFQSSHGHFHSPPPHGYQHFAFPPHRPSYRQIFPPSLPNMSSDAVPFLNPVTSRASDN